MKLELPIILSVLLELPVTSTMFPVLCVLP